VKAAQAKTNPARFAAAQPGTRTTTRGRTRWRPSRPATPCSRGWPAGRATPPATSAARTTRRCPAPRRGSAACGPGGRTPRTCRSSRGADRAPRTPAGWCSKFRSSSPASEPRQSAT
jgi:hypothetical protein